MFPQYQALIGLLSTFRSMPSVRKLVRDGNVSILYHPFTDIALRFLPIFSQLRVENIGIGRIVLNIRVIFHRNNGNIDTSDLLYHSHNLRGEQLTLHLFVQGYRQNHS